MPQFSSQTQSQNGVNTVCLTCDLLSLVRGASSSCRCFEVSHIDSDPARFLLDKVFSELLVSGLSFQQACTSIHSAMVELSQQRGFTPPAWPHKFQPDFSGLRAAAEGAPLGKLSAAASGLPLALPDGNHGDNDFSTGCKS